MKIVLIAIGLVIVGVGAFFVIVSGNRSNEMLALQNEMVVKADLQSIHVGLTMYEASSGRAPTTEQGLDSLLTKPVKEPVPAKWRRWLDELPLDPWKHAYRYRFPATKSKKHWDIWSAGADGLDNTVDDIGNW